MRAIMGKKGKKQCFAIVLYKGEEEEEESPEEEQPLNLSFWIRQLPSFYQMEERYALVCYNRDDSFDMDRLIQETDEKFKLTKSSELCSSDLPGNELETETHALTVHCRPKKKLPPPTFESLPNEIIRYLFSMLSAESLCNASVSQTTWVPFVNNQKLWKRLCQSKWQVRFNELIMPTEYYEKPKKMYKFMSTVWKRVRKQCQVQQRVSAIATILNIPRTSARNVALLCDHE